jgi:hypothetical protein
MSRIARLSALPPTRYFTALRRTSCAPANLVLRSLFARHARADRACHITCTHHSF